LYCGGFIRDVLRSSLRPPSIESRLRLMLCAGMGCNIDASIALAAKYACELVTLDSILCGQTNFGFPKAPLDDSGKSCGGLN